MAVAPEHLERVVGRLRSSFAGASVLTARAIEQRLNEQTWLRPVAYLERPVAVVELVAGLLASP